jgi:hypothetical protein
VAASSNTTWLKGFSGKPAGETGGDGGGSAGSSLAELVAEVGGEWVTYPPGGDDAVLMLRREALARTAWTRAVIDGDMTAIKLVVELLEGKLAGAEAGGIRFNADDLAAAEALLGAWLDGARPADGGGTDGAPDSAPDSAPSGGRDAVTKEVDDDGVRGETVA